VTPPQNQRLNGAFHVVVTLLYQLGDFRLVMDGLLVIKLFIIISLSA
jgi:hypothetical protein